MTPEYLAANSASAMILGGVAMVAGLMTAGMIALYVARPLRARWTHQGSLSRYWHVTCRWCERDGISTGSSHTSLRIALAAMRTHVREYHR